MMILKIKAFMKNDARQIRMDPMLMASLFGPLAIIVVARYVFPPLSDWIQEQYGFLLMDYSNFAVTFLMLVIPLLPGTMAGLLMLDERDENMIAYYAITPFTRKGYFLYRLLLPCALAISLASLFILLSGMAKIQIESLYTIVLLTLEAPCLALFLATFASNKVEGLALSKISGLLFAGPIIAAFTPLPWQYLGAWIPSYWPAKSYLLGIAGEPSAALGVFGIGLAYHLILLITMFHSFLKRID
ncbi:hypothetical protein AB4Z45_19555 [Paenibacillus sp. MCAF9]|uniref:hypothetical protein n=1 Tax=Paenibacillus sp. MCAF9 TaxID=3233046 RepID=UPI003F9DBF8D